MIFSSFEFLLFFAAVLALRSRMPDLAWEKRLLLGASWLFYMSWGPRFVLLIIFTSLVDWWIGRRMGEIEDPRARRRLLVTSLVLNLGVLAFFKYTNFLVENGVFALRALGLQLDPVMLDVVLPVGVSFFTFQSMSYTIDVYRREIPPCRSAVDLCLFVAFFPQLVAGPIVRASDFLPQLARRPRATPAEFETGLVLFGIGAFKKLVISDQVAPYVDMAFARPADFGAAFLAQGLLGYAIQIYCDFSGYSDMAIGCARMMGYEFKENFRMPYAAASIADFWRRWHISLSTWFRDYVYVPLGGSRTGRTSANLIVTMLVAGLWHGAAWKYVMWGGLHGCLVAGERRFAPMRAGHEYPLPTWRTWPVHLVWQAVRDRRPWADRLPRRLAPPRLGAVRQAGESPRHLGRRDRATRPQPRHHPRDRPSRVPARGPDLAARPAAPRPSRRLHDDAPGPDAAERPGSTAVHLLRLLRWHAPAPTAVSSSPRPSSRCSSSRSSRSSSASSWDG
jgi:alginate O-acetyltransferase complex protein AlgI